MRTGQPIRRDFTILFQIRFCLIMAAGSIVTSVAFYLYLDQGLGESYYQGLMALKGLETALPRILVLTFSLQLIFILLLTFAVNLFVSHKIAGPVYRYEIFLKQLMEGDLKAPVRTREGDQLKNLVDSMNGLQESMREVFSGAAALREVVARSGGGAAAGDPEARAAILDGIESVRGSMGVFSLDRMKRPRDAADAGLENLIADLDTLRRRNRARRSDRGQFPDEEGPL